MNGAATAAGDEVAGEPVIERLVRLGFDSSGNFVDGPPLQSAPAGSLIVISGEHLPRDPLVTAEPVAADAPSDQEVIDLGDEVAIITASGVIVANDPLPTVEAADLIGLEDLDGQNAFVTCLPLLPDLPATVELVVGHREDEARRASIGVTIEPPRAPPDDHRGLIARFIEAA